MNQDFYTRFVDLVFYEVGRDVLSSGIQCDQIGRFFGLLGNFSKPLATIILPKSPTLLGNFCKGVKILSSEVIFGQLLQAFGDFLLVTLVALISR